MTPHAAAALHAANRRGVLAISAGMISFVANDTLVKYVSETLPASQLIFLRGLMAWDCWRRRACSSAAAISCSRWPCAPAR